MRSLILVALFVLVDVPASAYCLMPTAPPCASRYGKFDDEWDFQRCRREIESLRSETEQAMQCLRDQFSETVRAFNRRANSTD